MCGLPSRDPGTQGILFGPTGRLTNAIFGKGTSQKVADAMDKAHMKTVGKVIKPDFIKRFGILPNSNPTLLVDQVDTEEEKRKKRLAAGDAERDRIYKSLGQTSTNSTVLGG